MYKKRYLLLIIGTMLSMTLYSQLPTEKDIIGSWSYGDKYSFNYFKANKDFSFKRVSKSCKGKFTSSGTYLLSGDTLILTEDNNQVKKFILRNDMLLTHHNKSGEYRDFEPLVKTRYSTKWIEYIKSRKKIRKDKRIYIRKKRQEREDIHD